MSPKMVAYNALLQIMITCSSIGLAESQFIWQHYTDVQNRTVNALLFCPVSFACVHFFFPLKLESRFYPWPHFFENKSPAVNIHHVALFCCYPEHCHWVKNLHLQHFSNKSASQTLPSTSVFQCLPSLRNVTIFNLQMHFDDDSSCVCPQVKQPWDS